MPTRPQVTASIDSKIQPQVDTAKHRATNKEMLDYVDQQDNPVSVALAGAAPQWNFAANPVAEITLAGLTGITTFGTTPGKHRGLLVINNPGTHSLKINTQAVAIRNNGFTRVQIFHNANGSFYFSSDAGEGGNLGDIGEGLAGQLAYYAADGKILSPTENIAIDGTGLSVVGAIKGGSLQTENGEAALSVFNGNGTATFRDSDGVVQTQITLHDSPEVGKAGKVNTDIITLAPLPAVLPDGASSEGYGNLYLRNGALQLNIDGVEQPIGGGGNLQETLDAGATLTKDNTIALGTNDLTVQRDATHFEKIGDNGKEIKMGEARLTITEDAGRGVASLIVRPDDFTKNAVHNAYKKADGTYEAGMYASDENLNSWKQAHFLVNNEGGASVKVNVDWLTDNTNNGMKGIAVKHGDGSGEGTIEIDPEVLPEKTGVEKVLYYDETTKQVRKGAAPSGSGGGSVGTLEEVTTNGNTTTKNVFFNGEIIRVPKLADYPSVATTNEVGGIFYHTGEGMFKIRKGDGWYSIISSEVYYGYDGSLNVPAGGTAGAFTTLLRGNKSTGELEYNNGAGYTSFLLKSKILGYQDALLVPQVNGSPSGIKLIAYDHSQGFYGINEGAGYNKHFVFEENGKVNIRPVAVDPSGAANGDVAYNSTSHRLRAYVNGAFQNITTDDKIGNLLAAEGTIYVNKNSPNATDTRVGVSKYSASIPFLTVNAAYQAASDGDIIQIVGGLYNEHVQEGVGAHGSKTITFILYSSQITTIEGASNSMKFHFIGYGNSSIDTLYGFNGTYITVNNVAVKLVGRHSADSIFRNLSINTAESLWGGIFENCDIVSTRSTGPYGVGVFDTYAAEPGVTFRNCRIKHASAGFTVQTGGILGSANTAIIEHCSIDVNGNFLSTRGGATLIIKDSYIKYNGFFFYNDGAHADGVKLRVINTKAVNANTAASMLQNVQAQDVIEWANVLRNNNTLGAVPTLAYGYDTYVANMTHF